MKNVSFKVHISISRKVHISL